MENIADFSQLPPHFGFDLSPEQRSALSTSLQILKKRYRLGRVVLWGKVKAAQRDYFIAQGWEGDLVGGKKISFVSQSLTVWAQLGQVSEAQRTRAKTLTGIFTGDLSYEYIFKEEVLPWEPANKGRINSDGEEEIEEDEMEEEDENEVDEETAAANDPLGGRLAPVPKRKKRFRRYPVTEEQRLSCLVQAVDKDNSVVPRGAFVIDQGDRVSANPQFTGLSPTEASNLSFYCHLRRPDIVPKKSLLEKYNANLLYDFLDRLSDDVPKGSWSLHFSGDGKTVTLRSLVWPGYFAFHQPGTNKFGAFYCGTGQYNYDFGFMI